MKNVLDKSCFAKPAWGKEARVPSVPDVAQNLFGFCFAVSKGVGAEIPHGGKWVVHRYRLGFQFKVT